MEGADVLHLLFKEIPFDVLEPKVNVLHNHSNYCHSELRPDVQLFGPPLLLGVLQIIQPFFI